MDGRKCRWCRSVLVTSKKCGYYQAIFCTYRFYINVFCFVLLYVVENIIVHIWKSSCEHFAYPWSFKFSCKSTAISFDTFSSTYLLKFLWAEQTYVWNVQAIRNFLRDIYLYQLTTPDINFEICCNFHHMISLSLLSHDNAPTKLKACLYMLYFYKKIRRIMIR